MGTRLSSSPTFGRYPTNPEHLHEGATAAPAEHQPAKGRLLIVDVGPLPGSGSKQVLGTVLVKSLEFPHEVSTLTADRTGLLLCGVGRSIHAFRLAYLVDETVAPELEQVAVSPSQLSIVHLGRTFVRNGATSLAIAEDRQVVDGAEGVVVVVACDSKDGCMVLKLTPSLVENPTIGLDNPPPLFELLFCDTATRGIASAVLVSSSTVVAVDKQGRVATLRIPTSPAIQALTPIGHFFLNQPTVRLLYAEPHTLLVPTIGGGVVTITAVNPEAFGRLDVLESLMGSMTELPPVSRIGHEYSFSVSSATPRRVSSRDLWASGSSASSDDEEVALPQPVVNYNSPIVANRQLTLPFWFSTTRPLLGHHHRLLRRQAHFLQSYSFPTDASRAGRLHRCNSSLPASFLQEYTSHVLKRPLQVNHNSNLLDGDLLLEYLRLPAEHRQSLAERCGSGCTDAELLVLVESLFDFKC